VKRALSRHVAQTRNAVIRELLGREEIQLVEAPSDSPAMATVKPQWNSSCLLPAPGPAPHPAGHSFSQWPDSTRDRLPNPSGPEGHAFERLPRWEIRATERQRQSPGSGRTTRRRCGWKISRKSRYGPVHAAPPFPGADRHESSSVSEAASVAGGAGSMLIGVWMPPVRPSSGLRECQPIQSRIQPSLRPATDARYSDSSLAGRSAVGVGRQSVTFSRSCCRLVRFQSQPSGV